MPVIAALFLTCVYFVSSCSYERQSPLGGERYGEENSLPDGLCMRRQPRQQRSPGGGVAHRAGHPGSVAGAGFAALNTNAIAARAGAGSSLYPSLPQQGGVIRQLAVAWLSAVCEAQEDIRTEPTAGRRPSCCWMRRWRRDERLPAKWGAVAGDGIHPRPCIGVGSRSTRGARLVLVRAAAPLWLLLLARVPSPPPWYAISLPHRRWAKQRNKRQGDG